MQLFVFPRFFFFLFWKFPFPVLLFYLFPFISFSLLTEIENSFLWSDISQSLPFFLHLLSLSTFWNILLGIVFSLALMWVNCPIFCTTAILRLWFASLLCYILHFWNFFSPLFTYSLILMEHNLNSFMSKITWRHFYFKTVPCQKDTRIAPLNLIETLAMYAVLGL